MKSSIITLTAAISILFMGGTAYGESKQFKAPSSRPTFNAVAAPKPAVCGPGFTVIGKKVVEHEGNRWYEYSCARQETITRICNTDTDVMNVKDKITSLPSDGQSKNSKLQLSYKCYNFSPIE